MSSLAWLTPQAIGHWRQLNGFLVTTVLDGIDDCRLNHTECRAKVIPVLPSIVLDVTTSFQDGSIRLHVPKPDERSEYVALSYCWGGPQKILTTVANLSSHHHGQDSSGVSCGRYRSIQHLGYARVVLSRTKPGLQKTHLWWTSRCFLQLRGVLPDICGRYLDTRYHIPAHKFAPCFIPCACRPGTHYTAQVKLLSCFSTALVDPQVS